MIWFTADPHLGHENIVKYCRRPFWTTAGDIRKRFAENRVPDHVKDEERWPDIEKHDETLIENWNSRVAVDDEVWIIGDFCWWHLDEVMVRAYYARLNGYKHLVLGNHDTDGDDEPLPVLVDLFGDRLHRYKQLRIGSDGRRKPLSRKGGQRVILFHYAMRGWENDYHNPAKGKTGSWHLYGHYHGRLMSHRTSFDVGVDVCNYAPVSWPEVEQKMRAILNEKDPI